MFWNNATQIIKTIIVLVPILLPLSSLILRNVCVFGNTHSCMNDGNIRSFPVWWWWRLARSLWLSRASSVLLLLSPLPYFMWRDGYGLTLWQWSAIPRFFSGNWDSDPYSLTELAVIRGKELKVAVNRYLSYPWCFIKHTGSDQ